MHALSEHLVIEHEVVGVFQQRQLSKHFAAEGAVPGVILGELDSQKDVFKCGKKAVGDVFVKRHAAEQGAAANDARSEHNIVYVIGHHTGHGGGQQRSVLVVGMNHNDDVGASG